MWCRRGIIYHIRRTVRAMVVVERNVRAPSSARAWSPRQLPIRLSSSNRHNQAQSPSTSPLNVYHRRRDAWMSTTQTPGDVTLTVVECQHCPSLKGNLSVSHGQPIPLELLKDPSKFSSLRLRNSTQPCGQPYRLTPRISQTGLLCVGALLQEGVNITSASQWRRHFC